MRQPTHLDGSGNGGKFGKLFVMPYAKQVLFLSILAVRLAGQAADAYVETPIADLCTRTSGTYAPVSTRGIVIDAFQDDIDPNVSFLLLKDGEYAIPVAITRLPDERLRAFLDCEVTVKGECLPITEKSAGRARPPRLRPTVARCLSGGAAHLPVGPAERRQRTQQHG